MRAVVLFGQVTRAILGMKATEGVKSRALDALEAMGRDFRRPEYGERYADLLALATGDARLWAALRPHLPELANLLY
jgi:hypothetical protein